jgi:hypothetical protein
MKKLLYIVPVALLFLSPFVHYLVFTEIRTLMPDITVSEAHGWVLSGQAVSLCAMLLMAPMI